MLYYLRQYVEIRIYATYLSFILVLVSLNFDHDMTGLKGVSHKN